jgi:hypothetical protein
MLKAMKPDETAIRAQDIVTCMERTRTTDYEVLSNLGLAVRMAVHLRGAPPVEYELLKKVAVHVLNFQAAEVKPVLQLLAEAEFVDLVTEGTTVKTVIPDIPFFENLYQSIGQVALVSPLTETEQLSLEITRRLSESPVVKDSLSSLGAEPKLVNGVLQIGDAGGFILNRRTRGRDILISPTYFGENEAAYADLVAAQGSGRVQKVLKALRGMQGWPLALIERGTLPSGVTLDAQDLAVLRALAGDGFIRPPAIHTSHHGTNYFLFGPRPGAARLPLNKKATFEAAMALVAAVRQGQLLPAAYRVKWPAAILRGLRDNGFINANSEALEQYQQVALLKVGRLEHSYGSMYRFVLNKERPENLEAIAFALTLLRGDEVHAQPEEEVVLALRQGETYVEALIGRKRLVEEKPVPLNEEDRAELDTLLYGGGK